MTDGPLPPTPKQRGGITGKGFLPGQSGNPSGGVKHQAKMRKLMNQTLRMSQQEAIAALNRRWGSVKYVQDMAEFLAKLEGEMTKDSAEGARGIAVIILQNNGAFPLDPETFRAAARAKAIEIHGTNGDAPR